MRKYNHDQGQHLPTTASRSRMLKLLFENRVKKFRRCRPPDNSRGHLDGVCMTLLDLDDLLLGVISFLEAWSGTLAQNLRLRDRGNVDWRRKSGDGQSQKSQDAVEEHGDQFVLYGLDLTFVLNGD